MAISADCRSLHQLDGWKGSPLNKNRSLERMQYRKEEMLHRFYPVTIPVEPPDIVSLYYFKEEDHGAYLSV